MKKLPNPVCSFEHRNNNQPQKAKHPQKNFHRRKIKELVDAGRGCVFETPSLCLLVCGCPMLSVVFIYFSVDVHEIILNDLINRCLDGPTVLLI